jgi:tRNA pseudouridine13 synthase
VTGDVSGVGGRVRARPEDFRVEEIPAYAPDERPGGHLLLELEKTGWTTSAAVAELARALRIAPGDIGVAGLKDRAALTRQWISVPAAVGDALAGFSHPDLRLGPARAHGAKLRRGHLRGNRFAITVRGSVSVDVARARVDAKLAVLRAAGGLPDYFGEQRFGRGGDNVDVGLRRLGAARRARADIVVSAGQSALFNLYLGLRRERGLLARALAGDLLKKRATGGLFVCEDPTVDQSRLDAGELVATGPVFGSRMRAPPPDSPAAALEAEVLARARIDAQALRALGRGVPGTRRPLAIDVGSVEVAAVDAARSSTGEPLAAGVCLSFELPAGAYATQLLRELV